MIFPTLSRTDFTTCLNANLRTITRAVDAVYRRHLKPFNITESQLNLLAVVGQYREIAQSEVGKLLAMERSTVSRDLRRLIERGWIRRDGPANKRQLYLTDPGGHFLESVIPAWEAAMAETRALLGEEDQSVYRLRARVAAAGAKNTAQ